MLSHHDAIISSFKLQPHLINEDFDNLIDAPKLELERVKVLWSPENLLQYQELISPHLERLRSSWIDHNSSTFTAILLDCTNKFMDLAAKSTSKSVALSKKCETKSKGVPADVKKAKNHLNYCQKRLFRAKALNKVSASHYASVTKARNDYHAAVNAARLRQYTERDTKLTDLFSENPKDAFKYLKSLRKSKPTQVGSLSVGDKVYVGNRVADGFYDSMSTLKSCDKEEVFSDEVLKERLKNFQHIIEICKLKDSIEPITFEQTEKILRSMKKNVIDYYSITALHYSNAGSSGVQHLMSLVNLFIKNVNLATIPQLNVAFGIILYKGHGKDKTSDRSYRTISTCPFVAKVLDLYLRQLFQGKWESATAPTQYQKPNSSHELASLLVTEIIQYSLRTKQACVFAHAGCPIGI